MNRCTGDGSPGEFDEEVVKTENTIGNHTIQVVTIFLILSVVIGLSPNIHSRQNSDSLIPVLVSETKWTLYYWEQSRFGMLVPLVATPVQSLFYNMMWQTCLNSLAGMLVFLLASQYISRRGSWQSVSIFATAIFIATSSLDIQFLYFSTFQPYAVSLALGFAALAVAPDSTTPHYWVRLGLSVSLALVSTWVGANVPVILVPLVSLIELPECVTRWRGANDLGRLSLIRVYSRKVTPLILPFLLSLLADQIVQRLVPFRSTWVVLPPPSAWYGLILDAISGLWLNCPLLLLVIGGAGLLAIGQMFRPSSSGESARRFTATLLASVAYATLMAVLFKGRWRYLFPVTIPLLVAAVDMYAAAWSSAGPRPIRRAIIFPSLIACLCLVCCLRHGLPSLDRAKDALVERLGGSIPLELVDPEVTHVAGDYWRVWPTVFRLNMDFQDRGSHRRAWGVTHRSVPTEQYWRAVPRLEFKIATFSDDPEAEYWLRHYDLTVKSPGEVAGSFTIFSLETSPAE